MKKVIAFSLGIFVFLILYAGLKLATIDPSPKPQVAAVADEVKMQTAKLVIDYEDGKTSQYEKETGELTAFSFLKIVAEENNIDLQTKQYDFGVFVESIAGKKSNQKKAWVYYINGDSANEAADKYLVQPGDKIEWKYKQPEG